MFSIIFWIVVGVLIGWNFPQPKFAKALQDCYLVPVWNWIKSKIPGMH